MIIFKNLSQETIDKLESILKQEVKYRPRLRAQNEVKKGNKTINFNNCKNTLNNSNKTFIK